MNKKVIAAIIAVSVVVVAIGGYIGYTALGVHNATKAETVLSGVKVLGIDLGGRSVKEAATELSKAEISPDIRVMKVSLKDKEIAFELRNAGIVFNPNKTASAAYDVGRAGSLFENKNEIKKLKNGEFYNLEPIYDQDKKAFREAVLTLFAEQGLEFNKFTYELTDNTAKIKISDNFEEINFDKLFEDALSVLTEDDMSIVAEIFTGNPATAEEICDEICVQTTNARADEKDGITIIIPETNGIKANVDDISLALYNGKKEFDIPIERENAEVTIKSIQGDFFSDVLATFTTNYNQGVVGRSANIALAASKINDTVLNVEDVFSYNDAVGRITASNGYAMATVYTAQGMQPGIGGGICQVSSTLYNAVLYADLKIVNRQNHSYTVGYVKNGLDATVSYGSIDFKFKNNTKGPIKITASAGGGAVTVTIYGKKQNNNKITLQAQDMAYYPFPVVEKVNPSLAPGTRRVVQYGSNGVKATVVKTTTDENGNVLKQESLGSSYYQPMNQIVEVGPATTSQNPESTGESKENGAGGNSVTPSSSEAENAGGNETEVVPEAHSSSQGETNPAEVPGNASSTESQVESTPPMQEEAPSEASGEY